MKEIICKGFEEFKSKEPYPHTEKDSFERGARFMLNWACEWLEKNSSTYTILQNLNKLREETSQGEVNCKATQTNSFKN